MKKNIKIVCTFSIIAIMTLLSFSCKKSQNEELTTKMMNSTGDTISKGTIIGLEHETRGKVALLKKSDESRVVQFYQYYSTPAPNVDIFLSKTNTYTTAAECPRLGDLTSTGSFSYPIPAGINSDDYPYVIVWCVDYSALLGYVQLKK